MRELQWGISDCGTWCQLTIDNTVYKRVYSQYENVVKSHELTNKYTETILEEGICNIQQLQKYELETFTKASALLTEQMKVTRWYRFEHLWEYLHTDKKFIRCMDDLLMYSFYRDEDMFAKWDIPLLTNPMEYYKILLTTKLRGMRLDESVDSHLVAYFNHRIREAIDGK